MAGLPFVFCLLLGVALGFNLSFAMLAMITGVCILIAAKVLFGRATTAGGIFLHGAFALNAGMWAIYFIATHPFA